jgi:TRAP-type C4-dicarboxylate transport system permease small subunit
MNFTQFMYCIQMLLISIIQTIQVVCRKEFNHTMNYQEKVTQGGTDLGD